MTELDDRSLLVTLAPLMPGRMEALAEHFLVDALCDPSVRAAFANLIGPLQDRVSWDSALPMRQQTSDDGVARHDIVLTDSSGRRLNIELKGYAELTPRQVKALAKGSTENEEHRIDVLIAPNPSRFQAHPTVALLSWDSIDRIVGRSHQGFSRLWFGSEVVKAKDVLNDLLERAKYKKASQATAQWGWLWSSVNVIKEKLQPIDWGKSDGPKKGSNYWYYGASAFAGKKAVWVGWVLLQQEEKVDYRLILEDSQDIIPTSTSEITDEGFTKVKRAVQLWPSNAPDDDVDLKTIAERLREILSESEDFRERLNMNPS